MAMVGWDGVERRAMRGLGRAGLALAGVCALGGCALFQPRFNRHVPPPAKSVDLTRYLGRWYEMARYDSSFEHDCEAATAFYTLRPSGEIGVLNACRRGGPDGPEIAAAARARVVANSGNARLKVSFFGPFFIGNYWVLDHADDYSWSIVGEPTGGYLWLLTRARHPDPALRAALIARAAALGYDTTRLHSTRQG
jgi:apolipoprotein D and lipocalin family protein